MHTISTTLPNILYPIHEVHRLPSSRIAPLNRGVRHGAATLAEDVTIETVDSESFVNGQRLLSDKYAHISLEDFQYQNPPSEKTCLSSEVIAREFGKAWEGLLAFDGE
ncbi:hypothetical protein BBP40_011359 [Aspergillus hancockii]|nr:hypothetical protein BBP40_011359 [Aspergillus hancockii]